MSTHPPANSLIWRDAWPLAEGARRVDTLARDTFGSDSWPVWAAPGRVNLIGEHTDYNAGLCLPMALPHRTFVALRPRSDSLIRLVSAQESRTVWSGNLEDAAPGTVSGWAAYVVGVAWALREAGYPVGGFDAAVDSCVPYGAGLSSSAALECAFAVALDDTYQLGLSATDRGRAQLADAAIRAENEMAGAPTGGMDQAASLRCQPHHALRLDCQPNVEPGTEVHQVSCDLDALGLALLVIDTRAPHQLVDGQYAQRRELCERTASQLGVPHLRALADQVSYADDPAVALAQVLGRIESPVAQRRVRHVITEIIRVDEFVDHLRQGQVREAGACMDASHESLRYDYEVTCPELDVAVAAAREAGAVGARMTGGGFGGSAIALIPAGASEQVAAAIATEFSRQQFAAPQFLLATASHSAGPASVI